MSVGSVGKWFALSILVGALGATGCKDDDDDKETVDSGSGKDSGTEKDASSGKDSGSEEDATVADGGDEDPCSKSGAVCCGTPKKLCAPHTTSAGTFTPGCARDAKDAEVCGISTALIGFGDAGPAFLEIHAPGVDSGTCGTFLDNFDSTEDGGRAAPDAGTKGNGQLDRFVSVGGMPIQLGTPGCCTPKGFCSGNTDLGTAILSGATIPSNGGFGCMDSASFLRTAPSCYQQTPCDPVTGMIKGPPPCPVPDAGTDGGSDAGTPTDAGNDAAG